MERKEKPGQSEVSDWSSTCPAYRGRWTQLALCQYLCSTISFSFYWESSVVSLKGSIELLTRKGAFLCVCVCMCMCVCSANSEQVDCKTTCHYDHLSLWLPVIIYDTAPAHAHTYTHIHTSIPTHTHCRDYRKSNSFQSE